MNRPECRVNSGGCGVRSCDGVAGSRVRAPTRPEYGRQCLKGKSFSPPFGDTFFYFERYNQIFLIKLESAIPFSESTC